MTTAMPATTTPLRTRVRWAWQHHRTLLPVWLAPLSLLVAATFYGNAPMARWALMLGLLATCLTCARLTRYVVTRVAQIVALWEEDVPQHEGVTGLYAVPARHRGRVRNG